MGMFPPVLHTKAPRRGVDVVVDVVLEAHLGQAAPLKPSEIVLCQWPGHAPRVFMRVTAPCDHEQRATGGDEPGDVLDDPPPQLTRQHLDR